jgi:hypothetical protein
MSHQIGRPELMQRTNLRHEKEASVLCLGPPIISDDVDPPRMDTVVILAPGVVGTSVPSSRRVKMFVTP